MGIVLPPGVNRVPARGGRKLTSKQLTGSSNRFSNGSSNSGLFTNSKTFSNKQQTSSSPVSSSSGNFRRVATSPDTLSSPLSSPPVFRSGSVSSRRSSAPQNFRQPVRQSQQIRRKAGRSQQAP